MCPYFLIQTLHQPVLTYQWVGAGVPLVPGSVAQHWIVQPGGVQLVYPGTGVIPSLVPSAPASPPVSVDVADVESVTDEADNCDETTEETTEENENKESSEGGEEVDNEADSVAVEASI